jgi:hypothetical protein
MNWFPYVWVSVTGLMAIGAALHIWQALKAGSVRVIFFVEFERETEPANFWGAIILVGITGLIALGMAVFAGPDVIRVLG